MFEGRTIQSITPRDLLSLIDQGAREDETIDFKSDAYQVSSKITDAKQRAESLQKKRLALWTDISAFANAGGGWIICGIREGEDDDNKGVAVELTGIEGSADEIIRGLEQSTREGVRPFPHTIQFRSISLENTLYPEAIVIRVPRSYNAPHQIKDKNTFHIRRAKGNDNMTLEELRSKFTLEAAVREQIKAFRKERVQVIATPNDEETPVLLHPARSVILHVIPVSFYETSVNLSAFDLYRPEPWVSEHRLTNGRMTLDGYLIPDRQLKAGIRIDGYRQIYRNGIFEYVSQGVPNDPPRKIPLIGIASEILEVFEKALAVQRHMVGAPIVIMLSMTGVKDCVFVQKDDGFHSDPWTEFPFQKPVLLVPDILAEDLTEDSGVILQPLFDMLWGAAGRLSAPKYDKQTGRWITDNRD